MSKELFPVIGLEVHLQLKTEKKMFCNCKNSFENKPNINICPVCTGQPGAMPLMNRQALRFAGEMANALNCKINMFMRFDRKNYFYPDCPKNYQITQHDFPLGYDGEFFFFSEKRQYRIKIQRVQMEEDSAKLNHIGDDLSAGSFIDYNRSGVPLLEIVTGPDFEDAEAACAYLEFLKRTAKYLEISDCSMEKGSLRVDTNISLTGQKGSLPGYKVEIKNLNSFIAVKNAIEYEMERQRGIINSGNSSSLCDETRLWDAANKKTLGMRKKETESDYRYFPEPDIPPLFIQDKNISELKESTKLTPFFAMNQLINTFKIEIGDAYVITAEKQFYEFFTETSKYTSQYKKIVNWLTGDVLFNLRKKGIDLSGSKLTPKELGGIIERIESGALTGKIVKELMPELIEGASVDKLVEKKGIKPISSGGELDSLIRGILKKHPEEVKAYRNGKTGLIGFFMGEVMKGTKGQAEPRRAKEALLKILENKEE